MTTVRLNLFLKTCFLIFPLPMFATNQACASFKTLLPNISIGICPKSRVLVSLCYVLALPFSQPIYLFHRKGVETPDLYS